MAGAGHDCGGQHIVSNAVCDLADDIGRGRSHQHHIRPLGQRHMLHAVLEIPVEGIHQAFVARKGLEGDGVDKIGGILSHQHLHIAVELLEHTGQVCNCLGGDASGDRQNHGFSFQHKILSLRSIFLIVS